MGRRAILILTLLSTASAVGVAGETTFIPETERLYLSGTGPEDARLWEFRIDRGRRSGRWTTITVPSQWELEGFGEFGYGRHDEVRAEVGRYRTRFPLPDAWRGREVSLVFEGAMTDLEAVLNGVSVGRRHQGGFTRFAYDVTDLLVLGGTENVLEVTVWEASSDRSVNAAERDADYWVFGGIYRPVYLESLPPTRIDHLAIDARHDGGIKVEVEVAGDGQDTRILAVVRERSGAEVGRLDGVPNPAATGATLTGYIEGIQAWSAETPHLYELQAELLQGEEVLHRVRRPFGFRTIEVRAGEGLFVNGRRTLLKGINRHSFWPTTGRALTASQNRADAELIKELNANAVRASHYPPDSAFLEACDELGLYVIDELPGWHDAYRTAVGRRLVAEMVRRDVNHPSVILWANGNEGGWNEKLDTEFSRHDPQRRPVLHPQSVAGGFDTTHYPSWQELRQLLADDASEKRLKRSRSAAPLVLPTEMLHGLYDGGLGAGLADFWDLIRASARGAGGFLWSFVDEGVVRDDLGGIVDTYGNYGPDGLLGPFREKEPSFAAVRSIWSPVVIGDQALLQEGEVQVPIENRYGHTDLAACRFEWRWLNWPGPRMGGDAEPEVLAAGTRPGPTVAPGESGALTLERRHDADALEVSVFDPTSRKVVTRVIQVADRQTLLDRWIPDRSDPRTPVERQTALEALRLRAPGVLPTGALAAGAWRTSPSGWFRLEIEAGETGGGDLAGLVFPAAVGEPRAARWLGRGPTPVWRNRLAGPILGIWSEVARPGFYDGVLWTRVSDKRGDLIVVPETDGLFLGLSAPSFPGDALHARAETPPPGSLSIMSRISAIGTKFQPAEKLMPPAGAASRSPDSIAVWLFRESGQGSWPQGEPRIPAADDRPR